MSAAFVDLGRTAHEHARALRSGEYTAVELAGATLARLRAQEPAIHAYITIEDERALAAAAAADESLRDGDAGPLTGIPVALKDLIATAGVPTTAASRILEGYVPAEDATVADRLRRAGAVVVGKANLDEFAMGSSTEHSAYGATRNPWDLDRVPGGSSGGSAATVAARGVPLALGTDTGGSIRQPAALTGIVGLKPTYGRVSRYGVVAFASSLEQVGPFGRDAEDVANALGAIAGLDPRDSTTAPEPVPDYREELGRGLDGLSVAVPDAFFDGAEDGVVEAVEAALGLLGANGARLVRGVDLPLASAALPAYYLIAPAEASANLARYDGVKYGAGDTSGPGLWDEMERTRGVGFGPEVKRRIMLGTYALSAGYYDAYYLKAQRVRTLIREEFDDALADHDLILSPTAPGTAFRLGERVDDPWAMYLSDLYTIPANIVGYPAISMPCGFVEGLPVGLQLLGKPFAEGTLLRATAAYQAVTDWHERSPSVPGPAGREA
ncbi:MAG: Asp-tRNA(Asn)/Glu-tRNA(Gln) amidotransferase subunit GatA [Chloroflexi bacterium]|nr:Asp-tRNA(Asn)/Glu-tRNA(Gln) amidotransferase subunit GatA [Chloroflexota bacterium]